MRSAGFTLIELLVVIAIISLLTAIFVPCLQNSRQQAKALRCQSNIRQLLLGLATYEIENGTFPSGVDYTRLDPPPGGFPGDLEYDGPGWWWFNYIANYSKIKSGRSCPLWCPARHLKNTRLDKDVLCGNYGVNRSICRSPDDTISHAEFIGSPLSTVDISHPGQTLLMVDSGYSVITWWHATDVPPEPLGKPIADAAYVPGLWINKQKYIWPGQEYDALDGRHPNKTVNVGFVDGHVNRTKADDLFVGKVGDAYENIRPVWLPK